MAFKSVPEIHDDYSRESLDPARLLADPIRQFEVWFNEAYEVKMPIPNAMSLGTASGDGHPMVRTVLLKLYDETGFVFFTNYGSRKARQIEENARACLLFPWVTMGRQVIINGPVHRISTSESLRYFLSRPRGSQLGAWASNQSNVISSRNLLEMKLKEVKNKFEKGDVPLPSFWGGYRVEPQTIEFWQSQRDRLHDRFFYQRDLEGNWYIERLEP